MIQKVVEMRGIHNQTQLMKRRLNLFYVFNTYVNEIRKKNALRWSNEQFFSFRLRKLFRSFKNCCLVSHSLPSIKSLISPRHLLRKNYEIFEEFKKNVYLKFWTLRMMINLKIDKFYTQKSLQVKLGQIRISRLIYFKKLLKFTKRSKFISNLKKVNYKKLY